MLIIVVFVGITIAIAAYNFVTGNIAWGIVNSLFGLGGLVFLAQICQTRGGNQQTDKIPRNKAAKIP